MSQNLPDLKNQIINKELFEAFKKQLSKDFKQCNFPADFIESLEPNYARIHEKICFELQGSERNRDSNLMQLLNRVDISEAQLKRYLNENKNKSRLEVIAELIIKRELQKVVLKQFYKNKENS